MIGSPLRPMSPEKTSRWLPPSVIRRSTEAEPRMWPGLEELEREVLPEVGDPAVGHADHQVLHRDRVGQVVERLALRRPPCRAAARYSWSFSWMCAASGSMTAQRSRVAGVA